MSSLNSLLEYNIKLDIKYTAKEPVVHHMADSSLKSGVMPFSLSKAKAYRAPFQTNANDPTVMPQIPTHFFAPSTKDMDES